MANTMDALGKKPTLEDFIERHIKASGANESVVDQATREIVPLVALFDEWYFDPDSPIRPYIYKAVRDSRAGNDQLAELIGKEVEVYKKEMEELDAVPMEPKVDDLVKLVLNWEDWWYAWKEQKNIDIFFEDAGNNSDIYDSTDYGDVEKSMGVSNMYDLSNEPEEEGVDPPTTFQVRPL